MDEILVAAQRYAKQNGLRCLTTTIMADGSCQFLH